MFSHSGTNLTELCLFVCVAAQRMQLRRRSVTPSSPGPAVRQDKRGDGNKDETKDRKEEDENNDEDQGGSVGGDGEGGSTGGVFWVVGSVLFQYGDTSCLDLLHACLAFRGHFKGGLCAC